MRENHPDWLMEALLLSAVIFGPLAFGAVEPWSLTVLEILLFSLLVLSIWHSSEKPSVQNTVFVATVVIILFGLIQCLNPHSILEPSSIPAFTTATSNTQKSTLRWAAYAALLWSAPDILCNRPALRHLAWTVFLVGAAVAVIGIMQGGQGNNAYYGLRPVRQGAPFGPYANYDHAASLMVMSIFEGLGIFFARLNYLCRENNMGRVAEMFFLLILIAFLLIVIGFGIWKTHSRGGINSLFAAGWITCLLLSGRLAHTRYRKTTRCGLACAAAGYAVFLYFHPEWIGSVFSMPDNSTAYRLSMYRSGMQLLHDFPIFGIGMAAFQSVFPAQQEGFVHGIVEYAHNDWLELAISTGLLGVLVYAIGILLFLRRMIRQWVDCFSHELFYLSVGSLTAGLAFLLHGFLDFSFQIPANAVMFFIILCLLEDSLRVGKNGRI